jgi:AcrR family transcriptional regulator
MTKQKIIEEAFQVFAVKGYEGASLNEIAGRVGIKKPSIYVYFKSKEELFLTVLELEVERFITYINNVTEDIKDKSTKEQLHIFGQACVEYMRNYRYINSFWTGILFFPQMNISDEIGSKALRIKNICIEVLSGVMARGMQLGDIEKRSIDELIYSYLAVLQGSFIVIYRNHNFSLDTASEIFEIYWRGISAE